MFVPISHINQSIQWHFIRNQDNCRLSYLEAARRCPNRASTDSVDESDLESARNFVGWASSVILQAGKHVRALSKTTMME